MRCCLCLAFILLMVALLACTCSFIAPYWKVQDKGTVVGAFTGRIHTKGLVGQCVDESCEWVIDNEFEMWKDGTFTGKYSLITKKLSLS